MFIRYPDLKMKNPVRKHFLFLALLVAVSSVSLGQQRIVQKPCFDSAMKAQADSVKEDLIQRGYIVVKEATMTMESQYEMPVIVPLMQGTWYEFAFIGDMASKLYEVRMYDYGEKQVVYKKHYGDGMESNVIIYPYIPKMSQYHVIKPVQVSKKKKELCGYIIMFKKVK